jgi:hypothetical protein
VSDIRYHTVVGRELAYQSIHSQVANTTVQIKRNVVQVRGEVVLVGRHDGVEG